jgi:hypothetical protein
MKEQASAAAAATVADANPFTLSNSIVAKVTPRPAAPATADALPGHLVLLAKSRAMLIEASLRIGSNPRRR